MCVGTAHQWAPRPPQGTGGFFLGGEGTDDTGFCCFKAAGTQGVAPRLVSAEVDKSAALQQWEAFKW